jgi:uncharacterized protein YjiS (DUF1127 family)
MSNVHYNSAAGAVAHGAATEASFAARARAAFTKLASWRKLTLAERELNSLDDRMLEDIGVPRAEIHQRVWGGRV